VREGVRVPEISNEEGQRLLKIVRRSSGSVVTWRRAQMVLLSAQGMDVAQIAEVAFTSPDRVREVPHNFNEDGFDSVYPKYAGGRPPTFTLPQRQAIKKIALARPEDHGLPFSTWSLSKLAELLVAEGVVDDISHEGLRALLREEGVSFQVIKTFKHSNDPDSETKKNRVLELYDIVDGQATPGPRTRRSCFAWTSSGRSTCNRIPASSGRRSPPARAT
jgi:transposase